MTLHVPPAFASDDRALACRLIDEHPFAMLVTNGAHEPYVTHLPLLRHGETLLGHVARANPHWRGFAGGASLAIFAGPHAYVSPTWYAQPDAMVPTWNFAAVHVAGEPQILDEPEAREDAMARMVERFEGDGPGSWRFALTGAHREAMLGAIVAFRMPMTQVTTKLKLSQNRSAEDRARVAGALAAADDLQARATAAWMRALEARPDGKSR